jgi:hypothetical protein
MSVYRALRTNGQGPDVITAETAQLLFEEAGVLGWNVRFCTICGARAGYRFTPGRSPMWHGDHERCSEPKPPQPSTWQAVADDFNALPMDILDGMIKALGGAAEQNG